MRLVQLLKQQGLTMSQIKSYQANHQILVNGTKQKLATPLKMGDYVTLDGMLLKEKPLVYYLFNKPKGVVCTNNDNLDTSIKHYLPADGVFCVGRLDKESHGLMIITNDGDFANFLLTSGKVGKTYRVTVKDAITESFKKRMSEPFILRGRTSKEVIIHYLDDLQFEITLFEGMYHQIRRMVIDSGNRVTDLLRVKIGPYQLDDLKEGMFKQIDK